LDNGTAGKTKNKLLWFATWEARKGSANVAAAFRTLREKRPDLTLTIGGTGKSAEEIRGFFAVQDRGAVNVLGRISLEEQVAVFGSHDVFLFPSLSEGFGLALLEAMANGLPAVTTLTGFGADFCEHEQNAMVVAPNSIAIANAVERLLDDDEFANRIARAGRELARTFTIDRMAEHYERAFVEGVERKARR
jgi:glycosyltransferase involved in cell wall biosynthesis